METKQKWLLSAIFVSVLVLGATLATTTTIPTTSSTAGFQNLLRVQVCHEDGTCEEPQLTSNQVTSKGLNHTRDLLADTAIAGNQSWAYIELSTSTATPAGNETTCPLPVTGNGLDIAYRSAVRNEVGSGNFTMENVFSVTGTQNDIRTICLGNSSTTASNDLMAMALLSAAVNVANGDTLNITYSIAATNA